MDRRIAPRRGTGAAARDPARRRPTPPDATAARVRVSLRQLEAFCTVSMTGSVSAAARRLSRTQSAVSAAIGELESALGAGQFWVFPGKGTRTGYLMRRFFPNLIWKDVHKKEGF